MKTISFNLGGLTKVLDDMFWHLRYFFTFVFIFRKLKIIGQDCMASSKDKLIYKQI